MFFYVVGFFCLFFLAKSGHHLYHMTNVHLPWSWFLQLHILCEIDAASSVGRCFLANLNSET